MTRTKPRAVLDSRRATPRPVGGQAVRPEH